MATSRLLWSFIYISLALCLITPAEAQENSCGVVYDGLTEANFDMRSQYSLNTIAANWFGFGDNVLSYEWAVFSNAALSSLDFKKCPSQLRAIPDILSWQRVNKRTEGISSNLQLQVSQVYHTVVRTTFRNGEQLYAFSDGVEIVESSQPLAKEHLVDERVESAEARYVPTSSFSCPIDEANRCNSAQVSVAEKLNELYGTPVFFLGSVAENFFIDVDDDNDDDDDDIGNANHVWIFAPIVIGILLLLICCILLALILALLVFATKGSFSLPEREPREKKPPAAAPLDFEQEEESKGYGQRENAEAGDVATATVVEFPDTNIRRLSISHRDEAAAAVEEEPSRRSRIPHPVMSSASSSFRDYRSSVNH